MVDYVAYNNAKYANTNFGPLDALTPHPISIDDLGCRTNAVNASIAYQAPLYRWGEDPRGCVINDPQPRHVRPLPAAVPQAVAPFMPQRRGRTSIYRNKGETDEGLNLMLTEEQLLLCPPDIPGFALADKVYCAFFLLIL
jgi:hypothetical protein